MVSALADVLGCVDAAMVVVTTAVGDQRAGCLVGFHCQTSIEPEQYGVWISKANYTYEIARDAERLGVHFLSSDDHELAQRFGAMTGDDTDKFAGLDLDSGHPPLIKSVENRLVIVRTNVVDDGGDHIGIIGDVIDVVHSKQIKPFRLSMAGDITAGHDPRERHT